MEVKTERPNKKYKLKPRQNLKYQSITNSSKNSSASSKSTVSNLSKYQSSKYLKNSNKPKISINDQYDTSFNTLSRRRIPAPVIRPLEVSGNYDNHSLYTSICSNPYKNNQITEIKDYQNYNTKNNTRHMQASSSSYLRRNITSVISDGNLDRTQPRTPTHRQIQIKENINLKPKLGKNKSTNCFKINSFVLYMRCPYCNHVLNDESTKRRALVKSKKKEVQKIYTRTETENKENININENFRKIVNEHTYTPYTPYFKRNSQDIIYQKMNSNDFYINERGGFVFKDKEYPANTIIIVNPKPDYSRYQSGSTVLGKHKNIKIYESPAPEKKIIIRPLKY